MARRRTKSRARPAASAVGQTPARDPAVGEPFNNPFAGVLAGMRSKLAGRESRTADSDRPRPPATSSRSAVSRVREETAAAGLTGEAAEAASQAQPYDGSDGALAAAMEGVAELDHRGDRVLRRRSQDYSRIKDGRRDDLEEMASLVHFDIRYSEQYIRGCSAGVSRETLRKLEHGEFAVRAHLDLHGMVVEDAERAVDRFLCDSQRRGVRCVLLITGKGYNSIGRSGVLREKIPQWLAKGPSSRLVLAFVTARPCDGGEGALYVLLRRQAGRKNRIDVVTGGIGS